MEPVSLSIKLQILALLMSPFLLPFAAGLLSRLQGARTLLSRQRHVPATASQRRDGAQVFVR